VAKKQTKTSKKDVLARNQKYVAARKGKVENAEGDDKLRQAKKRVKRAQRQMSKQAKAAERAGKKKA
jgi:hypothetical protein